MLKTGIDLSCQKIRIFSAGKLYYEDWLTAAFDAQSKITAHGSQALELAENTGCRLEWPLEGKKALAKQLFRILADLLDSLHLLRLFQKSALYISAPSVLTPRQLTYLHDRLVSLGYASVSIFSQIEVAALGAGGCIDSPFSSCVVYIDEDTCTAGLFRKGDLVFRSDFFLAGRQADTAIYNWIRTHYSIRLNRSMIDRVHQAVFELSSNTAGMKLPLKGIHIPSGQSVRFTLEPAALQNLFLAIVQRWVDWLQAFMSHLEVEEQLDVYKRGVLGCGRVFDIPGFDAYLAGAMKTPFFVAVENQSVLEAGLLKKMKESRG